MADRASTIAKVTELAGLGLQVVIIGLLIWLVYKAYECGTDNSKCSRTIYSFIRTGTKYDKYTNLTTSTQGELVDDSKVTSANTCAKWCTATYGCNGFVWANGKCFQTPEDDTKSLILVPMESSATYINKDADHPVAGFKYKAPAGTDFSSNVAQRLGDLISSVTNLECALGCIEKKESNCIGYSYLTTSNTCQLVSNIANTVITTNMMSYTWSSLTSDDYTDSKF
jgi:hypothetical protein